MTKSFIPVNEPVLDENPLLPDGRPMHFDLEEERWYQGRPLAEVKTKNLAYGYPFFLLNGIGMVMLCIGLFNQERNFTIFGAITIASNLALQKVGFFSNHKKTIWEDANTVAYVVNRLD